MITRKFLRREKKGRFKRWLKSIPSAIKEWLYEHRKGLIATFTTIFTLIIVITCLTYIPYYARMPKAVEGNLFDKEVLSFLMVEGLERPDDAIEESFKQGKIHKTNKRGEPIKAYNALYYEYSCYTLEPLGDSYVLEVKNLFDQRQGDEFVYGKFYPREHIFSNSFVSGSNDCLIYRENEEGEGYKGAKYESVRFSAKYTTVIKRSLYIDIFVPAVDYFMMYPRTVTVTSMLEPNENGKYETVISFRCDLETKIIYKYKENKSVAKKFRKII